MAGSSHTAQVDCELRTTQIGTQGEIDAIFEVAVYHIGDVVYAVTDIGYTEHIAVLEVDRGVGVLVRDDGGVVEQVL